MFAALNEVQDGVLVALRKGHLIESALGRYKALLYGVGIGDGDRAARLITTGAPTSEEMDKVLVGFEVARVLDPVVFGHEQVLLAEHGVIEPSRARDDGLTDHARGGDLDLLMVAAGLPEDISLQVSSGLLTHHGCRRRLGRWIWRIWRIWRTRRKIRVDRAAEPWRSGHLDDFDDW